MQPLKAVAKSKGETHNATRCSLLTLLPAEKALWLNITLNELY